MMMRALFACTLAALLAGCAGTPAADSSGNAREYTPKSQTQLDTSASTRARLHTELAADYYSVANYATALQEIGEALKADPGYAPALNVQGLIYMGLLDDASAEQSFQRALRLSPQDSELNNNYGWFVCQRKQARDSIPYFMTALRNPLYTTPEKAWVNAGLCARRAGDDAHAEEYFKQALAVRPRDPQTLFNLADFAYHRGDIAGAKAYLSRIPPEVAQTSESLWLQLRVARRMGDRDAEASLGLQLRRQFPDSREDRALRAGQFE